MKWVFEELARGQFNTEQVWKMDKSKGLKCSKNAFWLAIRNPLYCGKIFIPKYKDEESYFVTGQHESLITETLFYKVQDILDGRKKVMRTKMVVDDNLPLRGFIICPQCGMLLSGSASTGSVFPEKLTFDGFQFRTTRINEALEYILLMDNKIGSKKKRDKLISFEFVPRGEPEGTRTPNLLIRSNLICFMSLSSMFDNGYANQ